MFKDIKAFLVSTFRKIKSKKILKRYPWLVLICLLTILIPIIIGFSYTSIMQRAKQEDMPKVSVSLYDAKGTTLGSSEIDKTIIDGSPLVRIFYDLAASKVKADKPTGFNRNQNFIFVVSEGSESNTYKCYFDENPEQSYLEDKNGQFYSPDKVAYENFMNSKYSEKVYLQSAPPSLSTSSESFIAPTSVDWSYHLQNGKITKSENYTITNEILTYRISGALDFDFSQTPTSAVFKVKNSNNELIFTGSSDDLYSLTAKEGDELLIDLEAVWEQNDNLNAFGTQIYSFKIICSEPSEFFISSSTVYGGQFLIISVSDVERANSIIYNVIKPSDEVQLTSESADMSPPLEEASPEDTEKEIAHTQALEELYSFIPTFTTHGGNAYAFLIIPHDIGNTTFSFFLSCGISKKDFTIEIKEADTHEETITEEDSENLFIGQAKKQAFADILNSTESNAASPIYFRDAFLSPEEYGFAKKYHFNDTLIYKDTSFSLYANIYYTETAGGSAIRAANIGKVVAAESSSVLGNYVIIDHGMGLYTWYCGLSTINVSVGDILKKGDSVGISGSTSLLCNQGTAIFCTINGVITNPDTILGKTIINS